VVRGESAERLLDGFSGQAASGRTSHVQRVAAEEWNDRVSKAAPGTASKAKLGIALIQALQDRGVTAHLGGSLVAAVFGAPRVPVDIDLEIPGESKKMADASEVLHSLVQRKGVRLVSGKDVFFIVGWDKASGVYILTYRHAVTQRELDPFDDDDDDDFEHALANASAPATAKVDFSSESIFESDMDAKTTTPKATEVPVYEPVFLIASYLNRLAANVAESKPDEKADRAQIIALLNYHIKSLPAERRPHSKADIATLITDSIVKTHIKDSNKHSGKISELASEIATTVAEQLDT